VEIGPVPDELWNRVGEIWSLAFEYRPQSYWEIWLKDRADLQHFGAFEGKQIYAVISIHDFEIRLANRWLPCGGVAGVACEPGRRGEGLVRQVMDYCLNLLHVKKIPLAVLGTDIPVFYERMGFAPTDWQYQIEASTSALAKFKEYGRSKNYKMISASEFEHCLDVHSRWSSRVPMSIRRSEARWQKLLFGPDHRLQIFAHKDGYMIADLKASEAEKKFVLREWVFINDQAYYDGLAFLSRLQSQYGSASWLDSDHERIFRKGMLSEHPQISVRPGIMSRVVHLKAFCEYLNCQGDDLLLRDPMCITAKADTEGLSPGELVQLASGFWRQLPAGWPAGLAPMNSNVRAFTCERF
jgi:predicted acetyltransferase